MASSNLKTPGVYINEMDTFSDKIVPVRTAVPAFIGYTPQASYGGKSVTNIAMRISSFTEFLAIYCFPDSSNSRAKQYSPEYYLIPQKELLPTVTNLTIDGSSYALVPDPDTIYYLYNSVRMFFLNGGDCAYIVSVGNYGSASGDPLKPGDQIVNSNVVLKDLLAGLEIIRKEPEVTMYICPEATLLPVADNAVLMESMLLLSSQTQTAISIFDVIGGNKPDPELFLNDIDTFRKSTGDQFLNYGAAYYPFVNTMAMQPQEIDYTHLFGGDLTKLEPLLNSAANPNASVAAIIKNILAPEGRPLTVAQNNNALLNSSKTYATILNLVLKEANILPPGGIMAGIITATDNNAGVWKAPANVSITGAASLPINLTTAQQDRLIDDNSGKAINVIRSFIGHGILIWGARTLDANNFDWKYIAARRTMTMMEQSCKNALGAYIFQPNTANTWATVMAAISNFLTDIWKQGGLAGASPQDAFFVNCGFGSTMTGIDVMDGNMIIVIGVAVLRPAEFTTIIITQKMQ